MQTLRCYQNTSAGAFDRRVTRQERNYPTVVKQDMEVKWLLRPWCCLPGFSISLSSSLNKLVF